MDWSHAVWSFLDAISLRPFAVRPGQVEHSHTLSERKAAEQKQYLEEQAALKAKRRAKQQSLLSGGYEDSEAGDHGGSGSSSSSAGTELSVIAASAEGGSAGAGAGAGASAGSDSGAGAGAASAKPLSPESVALTIDGGSSGGSGGSGGGGGGGGALPLESHPAHSSRHARLCPLHLQ